MAKGLKTHGLEEVRALRRRVLRQHSLGRIYLSDSSRLVSLLDELAAHIIRMPEHDDNEEKEW